MDKNSTFASTGSETQMRWFGKAYSAVLAVSMYAALLFVFSAPSANSQVQNMGVGTPTPDQSAILELSANNMGFLAPRMTDGERAGIPNPAKGLLIFNMTNNRFEYNAGTAAAPVWVPILSSQSGIPFSSITTATNTTATMTVGTGASILLSGSGIVESSVFRGSGSATNAVDLATAEVSGVLPVANGGTNSSTALANNRIMVSSGGAIVESAALANGQLLIGSIGAAPVAAGLTAGTNISIAPGPGSITINAIGFESPLTFSNGITRTGNAIALGGPLDGATTIGLGTFDLNFTGTGNITISKFNTAGFVKNDASGNLLSSSTINLASEVSGVLPVANGGTNSSTALVNNRIMVSSGGAIVESSALANGQLLIGSDGAAPVAASLLAGTNISIAPGPGSITINATGFESPLAFSNGLTRTGDAITMGGPLDGATTIGLGTFDLAFTGTGNLAISKFNTAGIVKNDASGNLLSSSSINLASEVSGVLPVANGGTNSSTALANNRIMVSSGGAIVESSALANGQLLIGSDGAAPVAASLLAGTNISITPGPGSITINATGFESPLAFSNGLTRTGDAITLGGPLDGATSIGLGTFDLTFTGTGNFAISKFNTAGFVKNDASGNLFSASGLDLATDVAGVLPVANGGTNSSTALANNRIMVSSGGAIVESAALANGQLLIGSDGAAPVAANLIAGANVSITNDPGSITIGITGLPTGSGDVDRIAFWSAPNQMTSSEAFLWFNADSLLRVTGTAEISADLSARNILGEMDIVAMQSIGIGTGAPSARFHLLDDNDNTTPQLLIDAPSGNSSQGFFSSTGKSTIGINNVTDNGNFEISNFENLSATSNYSDANKMLRIHQTSGSEGIVDINHQSRARAFLGAAPQSIPPSVWTQVAFDAESFDEHSEFATSQFTALHDGYYQVNGRVEFDLTGFSESVPSQYVSVGIYVNGTLQSQGTNLAINANSLFNNAPTVSDVIFLQSGQTIQLRVFQSSSASLNLLNGTAKTYVSIHKIS